MAAGVDSVVQRALEQALGGPVTSLETLAGGYSHETTLAAGPDGRVVLRRGQGVEVEASVMRCAGEVVPVPAVLAHGESDAAEFMVIEFVAGRSLQEVLASPVSAHDAESLGRAVAGLLAATSSVRFDKPGFFRDASLEVDSGPPWSAQLVPVAQHCMAECRHRLSPAEQAGWLALCERAAPLLREIDGQSLLVHSDFNPKNMLAARTTEGWQVTALLDWEFAHSGSPLTDAGNLLRFADDYPPAFGDAFAATMDGIIGNSDWRPIAEALDLFALSQLLTKPRGHPVADRVEQKVSDLLANDQTGLLGST